MGLDGSLDCFQPSSNVIIRFLVLFFYQRRQFVVASGILQDEPLDLIIQLIERL